MGKIVNCVRMSVTYLITNYSIKLYTKSSSNFYDRLSINPLSIITRLPCTEIKKSIATGTKKRRQKNNGRGEFSKNRHSKMKRNVRRLPVIHPPSEPPPVRIRNVCVAGCVCAWIAIVVAESICMSLVCIVRTCIGVVNALANLLPPPRPSQPLAYTYIPRYPPLNNFNWHIFNGGFLYACGWEQKKKKECRRRRTSRATIVVAQKTMWKWIANVLGEPEQGPA